MPRTPSSPPGMLETNCRLCASFSSDCCCASCTATWLPAVLSMALKVPLPLLLVTADWLVIVDASLLTVQVPSAPCTGTFVLGHAGRMRDFRN